MLEAAHPITFLQQQFRYVVSVTHRFGPHMFSRWALILSREVISHPSPSLFSFFPRFSFVFTDKLVSPFHNGRFHVFSFIDTLTSLGARRFFQGIRRIRKQIERLRLRVGNVTRVLHTMSFSFKVIPDLIVARHVLCTQQLFGIHQTLSRSSMN